MVETFVVKEKEISRIKGKNKVWRSQYGMWGNSILDLECMRFGGVFVSEQWVVLCAIQHKEHCNARLISYSKGYTLCNVANVQGIILDL